VTKDPKQKCRFLLESTTAPRIFANLCHKLLLPAICGWPVTSPKDTVLLNLMSVAAAMLWLCIGGGGRCTLYQVTFALRGTS